MVWYGMVWYGMVWYGMVWYGMTESCTHQICVYVVPPENGKVMPETMSRLKVLIK
jgi:hypothetical protein